MARVEGWWGLSMLMFRKVLGVAGARCVLAGIGASSWRGIHVVVGKVLHGNRGSGSVGGVLVHYAVGECVGFRTSQFPNVPHRTLRHP